jgi:hypothetical protein
VAPVQLWVRRPMMHCGNAGGKNHYHNSWCCWTHTRCWMLSELFHAVTDMTALWNISVMIPFWR